MSQVFQQIYHHNLNRPKKPLKRKVKTQPENKDNLNSKTSSFNAPETTQNQPISKMAKNKKQSLDLMAMCFSHLNDQKDENNSQNKSKNTTNFNKNKTKFDENDKKTAKMDDEISSLKKSETTVEFIKNDSKPQISTHSADIIAVNNREESWLWEIILQLQKLGPNYEKEIFTKRANKDSLSQIPPKNGKKYIQSLKNVAVLIDMMKIILKNKKKKLLDDFPISKIQKNLTSEEAFAFYLKFCDPINRITAKEIFSIFQNILSRGVNSVDKTAAELSKSFLKCFKSFKSRINFYRESAKYCHLLKLIILRPFIGTEVNFKRSRSKTVQYEKFAKLEEFENLKKMFFDIGADKEEGIFRVSADNDKLKKTLKQFSKGRIVYKTEISPHIIASVIKFWLKNYGFAHGSLRRHLLKRDPDFSRTMFFPHFDLALFDGTAAPVDALQSALDEERRRVFRSLVDLLARVALQESQNKMGAKNLSLVLSPSLFVLHSDSAEDMFSKSKWFFKVFDAFEAVIKRQMIVISNQIYFKNDDFVRKNERKIDFNENFDQKNVKNNDLNGESVLNLTKSLSSLSNLTFSSENLSNFTQYSNLIYSPNSEKNNENLLKKSQKNENLEKMNFSDVEMKEAEKISDISSQKQKRKKSYSISSKKYAKITKIDPNFKNFDNFERKIDKKEENFVNFDKIDNFDKNDQKIVKMEDFALKNVENEKIGEAAKLAGVDLEKLKNLNVVELENLFWVESKSKNSNEPFELLILRQKSQKEAIFSNFQNGQKNEIVLINKRQIFKTNFESLAADLNDLVGATESSIPTVLFHIKKRFFNRIIYTNISEVLISVNPFEKYPIYSTKIVKKYIKDFKDELPPHIYKIARNAHFDLMEGNNQSIIVCGDSGSGKTEASKFCIQYFTNISNSLNETELKIQQSIPLLEAFGNAKTALNHNSSRFGKYSKFHFDRSGRIINAFLESFLLETSRVVLARYHEKERNFHIFYQFILTDRFRYLKQKYNLDEETQFSFLGNRSNWSHNLIHDEKDFEAVLTAMNELGFTSNMIEEIFRIISSIIILGNIDVANLNETKNQHHLKNIAQIFQTDFDATANSLSNKMIIVGRQKQVIYKIFSAKQAVENRDALAKLLYQSLFHWIFYKVNHFLSSSKADNNAEENKNELKLSTIGILDIFGFEIFEKNSFEQLLINYTNEKLQEMFIADVFRGELKTMRDEGLMVDDLLPNGQTKAICDNSEAIQLFESSPVGIFAILEESSALDAATDASLLARMDDALPPFTAYRTVSQKGAFAVEHFSAVVEYDVNSFLDKNRQAVGEGLRQLLSSSQNAFLREIVDLAALDTPLKRKRPLSHRFRGQLALLASSLEATRCHYVKCIKSNLRCAPRQLESRFVLAQLRNCGVFDMLRIRRNWLPHKMTVEKFNYTFGRYLGEGRGDELVRERRESGCFEADLAREIIESFNLKNTKVGKTLVFMGEKDYSSLEALRFKMIEIRLKTMQNFVRCFIQRKIYCRQRRQIKNLQRAASSRVPQQIQEAIKNAIQNGINSEHFIIQNALKTLKEILTEIELNKQKMKILAENEQKMKILTENEQKKKNLEKNDQKMEISYQNDSSINESFEENLDNEFSENTANTISQINLEKKEKNNDKSVIEILKRSSKVSNLKRKFEMLSFQKK